jgi:mannose/fructose/N-acetylgalactosamine-specific phosphotransferase system component IIC
MGIIIRTLPHVNLMIYIFLGFMVAFTSCLTMGEDHLPHLHLMIYIFLGLW